MKHSLKEWFAISRYWSFPVSAMPVIVTAAYLCWLYTGPFNWLNGILALIGIVIIHAAGNILSDWADHRFGIDNEEAYAVPNLVFHKFEPKQYLTVSLILFAIGTIIGLVLTLRSGWTLLLIGGAGVVLTLGYSFLKYRALGDLTIFINFGVLPMLGTSYVFTGAIFWETLILSLPIGLITVAVLHANNTRDTESDRKAGIKTFAMLIGEKAATKIFIAYMMIPFIAIVVFTIIGKLPYLSLLSLIALIPAIKNIKIAAHSDTNKQEALCLDQKTAQLQLVFSLLLTIGLVIASFTTSSSIQ